MIESNRQKKIYAELGIDFDPNNDILKDSPTKKELARMEDIRKRRIKANTPSIFSRFRNQPKPQQRQLKGHLISSSISSSTSQNEALEEELRQLKEDKS